MLFSFGARFVHNTIIHIFPQSKLIAKEDAAISEAKAKTATQENPKGDWERDPRGKFQPSQSFGDTISDLNPADTTTIGVIRNGLRQSKERKGLEAPLRISQRDFDFIASARDDLLAKKASDVANKRVPSYSQVILWIKLDTEDGPERPFEVITSVASKFWD